jgi:uncharacterized protein YggU (UPF0235/DUF167 family)
MKIFVKTKTKAKQNKVTPPALKLWETSEKQPLEASSGRMTNDEIYIVETKSPPIQGKANDSIVELLAEYFKVTRAQVRLVSGASSKLKVFDISL